MDYLTPPEFHRRLTQLRAFGSEESLAEATRIESEAERAGAEAIVGPTPPEPTDPDKPARPSRRGGGTKPAAAKRSSSRKKPSSSRSSGKSKKGR